MTTVVILREHVDQKQVIQWLNDLVGTVHYVVPFNVIGQGWHLRVVPKWNDHSKSVLLLINKVEFEAGVDSDVITQFALTWS